MPPLPILLPLAGKWAREKRFKWLVSARILSENQRRTLKLFEHRTPYIRGVP